MIVCWSTPSDQWDISHSDNVVMRKPLATTGRESTPLRISNPATCMLISTPTPRGISTMPVSITL